MATARRTGCRRRADLFFVPRRNPADTRWSLSGHCRSVSFYCCRMLEAWCDCSRRCSQIVKKLTTRIGRSDGRRPQKERPRWMRRPRFSAATSLQRPPQLIRNLVATGRDRATIPVFSELLYIPRPKLHADSQYELADASSQLTSESRTVRPAIPIHCVSSRFPLLRTQNRYTVNRNCKQVGVGVWVS